MTTRRVIVTVDVEIDDEAAVIAYALGLPSMALIEMHDLDQALQKIYATRVAERPDGVVGYESSVEVRDSPTA